MIITRLVRLFTILKLTRRSAYFTLRDVRDEFATGHRARGLRLLKSYRRIKAHLKEHEEIIARMLAALIARDPAA
jgi:hypothetical protein